MAGFRPTLICVMLTFLYRYKSHDVETSQTFDCTQALALQSVRQFEILGGGWSNVKNHIYFSFNIFCDECDIKICSNVFNLRTMIQFSLQFKKNT